MNAQNAPASYHLETIAGGDFAGDGGPATHALLVQNEGLAVDSRGNVYIADAGDHRVRRISASGVISTVAGSGRAGFSGDGGPATAAQLRSPYGLAVDRNGNLYIADLGNARIRRVTPAGLISTIAGGGTAAPSEGAKPTAVALVAPRNIAIDSYGLLYFADFGGHRVYTLRESGLLGIIAGTGQPGGSGDGGPAVKAQLNSPAGLAVDTWGNVLIADNLNGRVRKVWRGVIASLGDGGTAGLTSIPLLRPAGLALDPDGSLYIADLGTNQVLRVSPSLEVTPIAQPARDLAVDMQGNLFACSGPLVFRRPRLGESVLVAGSMAAGYVGDGVSPDRARFQNPAAVARDIAGNLYIADTGNQRIRKITPDGAVLTVAGNGLRGWSGDGGAAIAARLNNPVGVAIDNNGNIYIADTGSNRIRKVDPSGVIATIAGTGERGVSADGTEAVKSPIDTPTWLAVDRDGALYFSEQGTHSVRKITAAGTLGTAAGNRSRGYSGDGGPAVSASLDTPQGLALDADGNLYIADSGNRRIRRVASSRTWAPAIISTVPDSNAAIWRGIRGIAVAPDGTLFVADTDDARLFRVDGPNQVLTIGGTGFPSFTAESGPALSEALNGPAGIVVDGAGAVYFTDSGNNRIRKLTPVIDATENPPPASTSTSVLSAASLLPGAVAPGQLLSLFGEGIGPAAGSSATTTVLFNDKPAPLFYTGPNQINLQAPYSLAGTATAEVQVIRDGILRAKAAVSVTDAAPAIFTTSNGSGQAAALNEDGSYNSTGAPAARGSVLMLFATGEGKTNPISVEGQVPGFPLPVPILPVTVRIGGYLGEVIYAGAAPGFPGLMQINVRIPIGFLGPGTQSVTLQVGTATSQPGVTVELK